jgi:homotetrameric cytidine deaminase
MAIAQGIAAALAEDLQTLQQAAEAARARAHAPYSGFQVGAALRASDGHVVAAGNVENASYGLTICAERAAIFRALAEGYTEFDAVAVAGPADTVSPCGACRQVLAEFLPPTAMVVFPLDARLVAVPLGELLPHAFGPSDVLSGS